MLHSPPSKTRGRVQTLFSKGSPVIFFNSLSWPRSDPVVIPFASARRDWEVQDAAGNLLPSQVLPPLSPRDKDKARLEFIASDVPGMGYKTFYLSKSETAAA